MFRDLIAHAHQNAVKFALVLCDSWYVNAQNINYLLSIKKNILGALKSNIEVALSKEDRAQGKFIKISQVKLNPGDLKEVYIRSVTAPVLICKDIFINEDHSEVALYLLCSDLRKSYQPACPVGRFIISTYQERWGIEDYHKSLKNNTSLQKSPTRTVQTQKTHFFASLCAYIKLERLKINEKLNHFALKNRLYIKAIQTAFQELQRLKIKNQIICA
jgi:hypothetical protein